MYPNPDINPRILTSVGKVIIAISWADGEIQHEEIECLRSLLTELPDIPPEHVQALESLLERPIAPTEREIILDELDRLITCQSERNFALFWLDRIMDAKEQQSDPLEREIYDDVVNRFLKHADRGTSGVAAIQGEGAKHEESDVIAIIDEIFNEAREFINPDLLSDLILKRMLMLGVLAARVTRADYRIDESEVEQLRDFIRRQTGIDKVHSMKLARLILVRDFEDDSDVHILCNLIKKQSTEEERNQWVDQLLQISEQDGIIVDEEMNQLVSISASLGVTQEHFEKTLRSVLDMTE